MFAYRKNYKDFKQKNNSCKKPPHVKITREFIKEAQSDFFKRGGIVTKITDEDIRARKLENLDFLDGNETYEFLNGE